MAEHKFEEFEEDGQRQADWDDAAEVEEEDGYVLPGYAESAGEHYAVEIALTAVGRWAEIDVRDLSTAEAMIESRLTVLLEIFPSFAVEYVRVQLLSARR